jgi:hypothetical protein
MKNTYTQLRQFIRENIAQTLSEIVDPKQQNKGTPPLAMGGPKAKKIPRWAMGGPEHKDTSKLPWVFGPEGYIKRSELSQQYEKKEDIGADSPPEVMVARALAYRASELTNYNQEFDDEIFSDYAMKIYQDYVMGKAGDKDQALDSMLNRIDDGGWDDEDIMDIANATEMSQTKDAAARQDPGDIGQMELDFDRYMQGIESGKVVELEQEDD